MLQEIQRVYFLGLDLAQVRDFSALSIIERKEIHDVMGPATADRGSPASIRLASRIYIVRKLERWKRMSYTQIGEITKEVFNSVSVQSRMTMQDLDGEEKDGTYRRRLGGPYLVMDSTGIGAPVRDHLRSIGLVPVPVILSAGDSVHGTTGGIGVPKRDVVTTIRVLLEKGQLKVASSCPLKDIFFTELRNFKLLVTPSGKDTYGATGSAHDDLVLAVSLPLWYAETLSRRSTPIRPVPADLSIRIFAR